MRRSSGELAPAECRRKPTASHYRWRVRFLPPRRAVALVALLVNVALLAAACSSTGETLDLAEGDSGQSEETVEANTASEAEPADRSTDEDATDSASLATTTTSTTTVAPTTTDTTTTTTTTTVAPTTTEAPRTAATCAAALPLEVRLGQLMFPVMTQDELPFAESLAVRGLLGGIVVLGSPNASIGDGLASLQSSSLLGPLIIAVDEEGGRVQRVDALVGSQPSAREVAATEDIAAARQRAADHAIALGELGFTMNLAPVVDLDVGTFIGDRSYGADPAVVSDYALGVAEGILDGGLAPVIKHFPGHGRGIDSHTGLPTIPGVETLRQSDLVPFERAIAHGDLPIMIGHLVVTGLTDGQPATLSPAAVNGLLRTELGFDGLVMTDALNMDAIAATTNNADAAELALIAGVDLVMLGTLNAVEGTVAQLADAVATGRISEQDITESFLRVMDQRELDVCSLQGDFQPAIGCEADSLNCR